MARPRAESGFTLIEVLVALVVVGLILSAVYQIFGTGILNVGRGSEELTLALDAEALLERTRADLDPRSAGDWALLPNGNRWRVTAQLMQVPPPAAPAQPQPTQGPTLRTDQPTDTSSKPKQRLWIVHVEVMNGAGRDFVLSTLRRLPERTS
jgi:prepilin-type N-terminal cleavage/methylation domain-containing protein